jgi:hypothetical protein
MAKWCFMVAYSYIFLVVEGMSELWPEKRLGFLRVVGLGYKCSAWLASTVEELLCNPRFEFVISSREGSKVLVVWRGGDRVAVYWKWLSMLLVVGVGGFCPLRAVKGADGAELLGR